MSVADRRDECIPAARDIHHVTRRPLSVAESSGAVRRDVDAETTFLQRECSAGRWRSIPPLVTT